MRANGECTDEKLWSLLVNVGNLTLPSGEDILPPNAEASDGPTAHPRINHKVTKSPGVCSTHLSPDQKWNHSPSPSENTHLGSPTITHSKYLRENVDFKSKSTLTIMTYKSETSRIQETHPLIKTLGTISVGIPVILLLQRARCCRDDITDRGR